MRDEDPTAEARSHSGEARSAGKHGRGCKLGRIMGLQLLNPVSGEIFGRQKGRRNHNVAVEEADSDGGKLI